jgi:hypothetical protein
MSDQVSWAPGPDWRGAAEHDAANAPAEQFERPFEIAWIPGMSPADVRPPPTPRDEVIGLAWTLIGQARAGLELDRLDAAATRALAERLVEEIESA